MYSNFSLRIRLNFSKNASFVRCKTCGIQEKCLFWFLMFAEKRWAGWAENCLELNCWDYKINKATCEIVSFRQIISKLFFTFGFSIFWQILHRIHNVSRCRLEWWGNFSWHLNIKEISYNFATRIYRCPFQFLNDGTKFCPSVLF